MSMSHNNNKIIAAASCAIVLCLLFLIGFLHTTDVQLQDKLIFEKQPLQAIHIIAIDDTSLNQIGRWPWNRSLIAKIVDAIPDSSVIGIDIGYFEPSNSPADDAALANSLRHKNAILVSTTQSNNKNSADKFQIPIFTPDNSVNANMNANANISTSTNVDTDTNGSANTNAKTTPATTIRNNPKHAYADVITDSDGITRALRFDLDISSVSEQAFSTALAANFFDSPIHTPRGRVRINFVGPTHAFDYISAASIIDGQFASTQQNQLSNDSIYILGATAASLKDTFQTPIGATPMPGAELHANIVQMLLQQNFLTTTGIGWTLIIIAICILVAYLANLLRPSFAIIVVVVAAIAYVFIAILFARRDILLPIVYPILALIVTHIAITITDYVATQRERKKIQDAFGKYISPKIVDRIITDKHELKLGGEKLRIGILFSDVRGFTTLSEALSPHKLVALLNKHLTAMSDIIHAQDGIIDKYIGDAIMALWNVPLPTDNFEEKMALAAISMTKTKVSEKIAIGIGLHVGEAVVGNMGSNERFDYTAIGDNVNLTSRLESLTKQYGVGIIATEEFANQLPANISWREIDRVQVKGKHKPVTIVEICLAQTPSWHAEFAKALKLYQAGDFLAAKKIFSILALNQKDATSRLFANRCDELLRTRPENWQGVWEHKSK